MIVRRGQALQSYVHFCTKIISRGCEPTWVNSRHQRMETKQDFRDELERYRVLLAETTDPVGLLLLKDIISEMEEIERKWDDLKQRP